MTEAQIAVAKACLAGAENDSMAFPDIVGALVTAGFEGYSVDFRAGTATYYAADQNGENGSLITLHIHAIATPVAPRFDADAMQAAIREAQANGPDYTYAGFCEKAAAAGCASYLVSFTGRRVLYVGRDGGTHVEHFPD